MTYPQYPLQKPVTGDPRTAPVRETGIVGQMADKLNAYIDVKADFGAVGDGETAATTEIQDAIDAAEALLLSAGEIAGVPTVVIPPGDFRIGNLTVTEPIRIVGSGWGTKLRAAEGTTGYLLTVSAGTITEGNRSNGFEMSGIYFDGNGREEDCGGIQLNNVQRARLSDLQVRFFKRSGIDFDESVRNSRFTNVYLKHCGDLDEDYPSWDMRDNVDSNDGHNLNVFVGSEIVNPHGAFLELGVPGDGPSVRNNTFLACIFHGWVDTPQEIIDGYTIPNSHRWRGATVRSKNAQFTRFIGCRFHSSGPGVALLQAVLEPDASSSPNSIMVETSHFGDLGSWNGTFTAADTDICTSSDHELVTGAMVQVSTTGTLPAGLSASTDYFAIRIDDDTFELATSLSNAYAGTAVDITDAGTGTHTITSQQCHVFIEESNYVHVGSGCTFAGSPRASIINKDATSDVLYVDPSLDSTVTVETAGTATHKLWGALAVTGNVTPTGIVEPSGGVILPNNVNLSAKNSTGTSRTLARIRATNILDIGDVNNALNQLIINAAAILKLNANNATVLEVHPSEIGLFGKAPVVQPTVAKLTNNTGVAGDDTVENVPAATAADTDTSAASLASTNTAITAIENDIADLTAKLNALLDALGQAGTGIGAIKHA